MPLLAAKAPICSPHLDSSLRLGGLLLLVCVKCYLASACDVLSGATDSPSPVHHNKTHTHQAPCLKHANIALHFRLLLATQLLLF